MQSDQRACLPVTSAGKLVVGLKGFDWEDLLLCLAATYSPNTVTTIVRLRGLMSHSR